MKEQENRTNKLSLGIIFPAIIFLLAGIYFIFFPVLYDMSLYNLIILSSLCIISSAGLFLVRKWGLWLALALSPFIAVTVWSAFIFSRNIAGLNPNIHTEIFQITLIVWIILILLSCIFLLSNRKVFK
ncbi:MAG: hypothetical protein NWF08_06650 [Candidatus Bathyarchaeota archaeon]|nr:hypothetical protein [Candidatus Bathyarchaeota archaeon]